MAMMKMREKLMKKGKEIKDPVEKEALEGLFGELRDSARSAMKGGLGKVGKVKAVVSADNKEDLKKGLEKAKEVVSDVPEMEDEMMDDEMMGEESEGESIEEPSEEESGEVVEVGQDADVDEIEAAIKKLEELKKSKIGY